MKQNIYIFNEEGMASMYGIGTYIKSLEKCFCNSQYNLTLINFNSNTNEVILSCRNNTNVIDIPRGIYSLQKDQNLYYKNLIFLLRVLIPHHDDKNVFFFNYQCNAQMIPSLRKYYPKTQIIFIVHYLNWALEILGNTTLFKNIISKPLLSIVDESEKKIYQLYKDGLEIFNNVDKIVCLSQYTKKILYQQYKINKQKIYLIYNGLQNNTEQLISKKAKIELKQSLYFLKKEKLILYVGRLDRYKGGIELIEAFRILLKKNPNCKLIIIGNGDDSIYFERTDNIWAKVIFTGKLNRDLVYKFYQIADVGVLPSFSEQCSYVAIEMMMHGLPIIGTDSTGLSEMILDGVNGYKVKLKESNDCVLLDISELSELIKKVIENPELQKKLAEGARKRFLSQYAFELMKKKYRDIVRE